jgi:hypothetical protein
LRIGDQGKQGGTPENISEQHRNGEIGERGSPSAMAVQNKHKSLQRWIGV